MKSKFDRAVLSCLCSLPVFVLLAALCGFASAQVPDRLPERIDATQSRVLADHHPRWANAPNDLGIVPPDRIMGQMTLVLARSPQQQAAFDKLIADQQTLGSPDYHHWLTPAEYGARFGLSDADIATITTWLQSQGLRVNWVSPSRTFIGFAGTSAAVSRAFRTEIHTYRVQGELFTSVLSDPSLPAALAPVVQAVRGLYTIRERPMHRMIPASAVSPDATTSNGQHFIAPADFRTIYDEDTTYTGTGQTIGIVGQARTDSNDFNNFNLKTGAGLQLPTEIVPTTFGGVDPGPALTTPPSSGFTFGDQGEATLDVLRAGSTAPGANLLLIIATSDSGGIGDDTQYLVQSTPVPAQIINISYGACESASGPSGVAYWDTLFQQAAAEGISVFVSSGDAGASGCDENFGVPPALPAANSPNYICSSSYATCVGGTEFADAASPSTYWNSGNSSTFGSAKSYIPEGGWNEPLSGSATQTASSGGGVSSFIATPSWQTGTGVPSARLGRYTPDISFSGSCHDGYFACYAAGGGDCVSGTSGAFSFVYFCGTSAAAPTMAGVAAQLDQKLGFSVGNLNPELYQLAASIPSAFHDVTVATSGVAGCSVTTPSMCNNSIPGPSSLTGGQAGYLVTTGYDLVTGLGSLDVMNFLNNFSDPLIAPSITVTPSATIINVLEPLSVTVTVNGGAGNPTPSGSVRITIGDYTADPPLTGNTATVQIPARTLPWSIDSYVLTATYLPDAPAMTTYRTANGTCNIAVTAFAPNINVGLSATPLTTAQSLDVAVTVNGSAGNPTPSGTVNITGVFTAGGSLAQQSRLASGNATFHIQPGLLAPGSDRIDVFYMPDNQSAPIYGFSTGSSQNFTVTAVPKSTPTITITQSPPSLSSIQALTITVTVVPTSGALTPNGNIRLTTASYVATAALANGTTTFSIPAGTLAVGPNVFTAAYDGDYNFNASTRSITIVVVAPVKTTPTVVVTPAASTIGTTQSTNVLVVVGIAPAYPFPTGTVALTSGAFSSPATLLDAFGTAAITIPAGSLTIGTDTLTASYSGDAAYFPATGTASITVAKPAFAISGSAVTIASPGSITGNASTITVTPAGAFTGAVNLTASIASSPAGAQDPPILSFGAPNPVIISGTDPLTAAMMVTTTAPASASLSRPQRRPWLPAGGAALACLLLFATPGRRRLWRATVGSLALLVALSTCILACGGGGATRGPNNPGTTVGTYTVIVTGTSGSLTATATVSVAVQ